MEPLPHRTSLQCPYLLSLQPKLLGASLQGSHPRWAWEARAGNADQDSALAAPALKGRAVRDMAALSNNPGIEPVNLQLQRTAFYRLGNP